MYDTQGPRKRGLTPRFGLAGQNLSSPIASFESSIPYYPFSCVFKTGSLPEFLFLDFLVSCKSSLHFKFLGVGLCPSTSIHIHPLEYILS